MSKILLKTEFWAALIIASIVAVPNVIAGNSAKQIPASKKIDALVAKNYKEHKVTPNAEISDDVFLRRIYLDVIGPHSFSGGSEGF